jgi:hypothetical protein
LIRRGQHDKGFLDRFARGNDLLHAECALMEGCLLWAIAVVALQAGAEN